MFLALQINTGLVRKDKIREFWTTDIETITPFFSKVFCEIFTPVTMKMMMDQIHFSSLGHFIHT